ncbi:MAG: flavodoxin family protein [Alphaproteobacteria bacterium]|uniref:Flavodoxin family protein n=1 Tax=Candidatus Nitrobium versatile TaxID=2884831 RepID=A0A953JCA6_9BACT|nr:flavodoxin family protein [Candidatus Nitrobium versatile]
MKIVCLLGSPHPAGNSAAVAKRFLDTAASLGAETETFVLNALTYRGCQGCYACKTRLERCGLTDDLSGVLEAVREADTVVLATPTYYGDISSQLKGFIDRTYSYLKPDYLTNTSPSRLAAGKKLVFIITQGHPDEAMFSDIFPRYNNFLKWYGFQNGILLRVCGVAQPGEAEARRDVMLLAEETARKIVG